LTTQYQARQTKTEQRRAAQRYNIILTYQSDVTHFYHGRISPCSSHQLLCTNNRLRWSIVLV